MKKLIFCLFFLLCFSSVKSYSQIEKVYVRWNIQCLTNVTGYVVHYTSNKLETPLIISYPMKTNLCGFVKDSFTNICYGNYDYNPDRFLFVDKSTNTSCILKSLYKNVKYYLVVTSISDDTLGESDYSKEISFTLPITNLLKTLHINGIKIIDVN